MKKVKTIKAGKFFSWRYFRMAQRAMTSYQFFADPRLEPRKLMTAFGVYYIYMFIRNMADVWDNVTLANLLMSIRSFATRDIRDLLGEYKMEKLPQETVDAIFDYQFEMLPRIDNSENPLVDMMVVFECGLQNMNEERAAIAEMITQYSDELVEMMIPAAQDTIEAVDLFDLKDGHRI